MKKQPINNLLPTLAAFALVASLSVCRGTTVFFDDFSEASGTLIVGKSADLGGIWSQSGTSANGLTISSGNSVDTSGNPRLVFDSFTSSLGAGQIITLSFDTLMQGNNAGLGNTGWAGVSLYSGFVSGASPGVEQMFEGQPSANFWGKDGGAIGGQAFGSDGTVVNHLTLTYAYDTGAWTFSSGSSFLSGIGTANLALNGLRIGNGNGADINLDNLTVDISHVPEPSSIALVGAGFGLLLVLRRRTSVKHTI